MIPEKYKNTCPLDHSTFEKFIECGCNWGDPVDVWYFKEQQLAKLTNKLEKAKKYIELCPCDPDIYPDQLEAWDQYQEELKMTEQELSMKFKFRKGGVGVINDYSEIPDWIKHTSKKDDDMTEQELESCQSKLKEAVEIIEFYAESTTNLKARQFLAKYRGRNEK